MHWTERSSVPPPQALLHGFHGPLIQLGWTSGTEGEGVGAGVGNGVGEMLGERDGEGLGGTVMQLAPFPPHTPH